MVKTEPWMEHKLSLETLNSEQSPGVATDRCSLDKVVRESVEFENRRYWCNEQRRDEEYSFTFLGCSMEMLRSSLAKWAERNNGGNEESWRPSLFLPDDVRVSQKAKIIGQFSASADFTSCLQSLRYFSDMSKPFVKMRVLWDLQNHLQTHLPEEGIAPSRGEAIALCILSFPALYVNAARMVRGGDSIVELGTEDEELLRIDDCEYVIRASCGPQDIKLRVSFKRREEYFKRLKYR